MSDQEAYIGRVFFVRHGETAWAKSGQYTSTSDIDLTPTGAEQISSTAKILVGSGKLLDPSLLATAFVSPRKRATRTYSLLMAGFQMDVEITEDIAEWGYGDYEGLTIEEIRDRRKEKGLDLESPWDIWKDGCEQGESPQQVTSRLDMFISKIRKIQQDCSKAEKPANILVVAHGLVLRALIKRWLNHDLDFPLCMTLSPGAIGILSYKNRNMDEPTLYVGLLPERAAGDSGASDSPGLAHFDYQGHICIVIDLLGQSLFDFLKSNSFVPFPNSQIQSFAHQLLTSIAYIIHTDLKPENILLYDSAYQLFTYNRKIPISSRIFKRKDTQRRVLFNPEIHLIDFGFATFRDEAHSSVVSTRYYRAPEIPLGLGWSFPCDIRSIGYILVELFTGDPLFESHENLEQLAMMERIIGTPIDSHLVTRINKMGKSGGGNPASKYFKRGKLDYPQQITTARSQCSVKATKKLDDIVPNNKYFLSHFKDLLKKIFTYDPRNRITAKQALQHPWFKETDPSMTALRPLGSK